jgi:Family of unknown function (DUF6406)
MRAKVADIGSHIQVGQGTVTRSGDGIRFAGRNIFPAIEEEPATAKIAAWDENSGRELNARLREGDTLEIAGQTWRLDKIHSEGQRRWYADLTRIA